MQTKVDELLQVGKFLPVDLVNAEGVLIVKRDTLITESNIQTIRKHSIHIFDKLLQNQQQQRAFKVVENYEQAFEKVKSCFEEVRHRKIEPKLYEDLTESFADLLSGMIELKQSLDVVYTLKDLDDYTFRHSVNVGLIAAFIGRLLRLPETDVALLGQMGLLHDIGKMRIPQNILNKPARLTDIEFNEIKKHPSYGYFLLKDVQNINMHILLGTLMHHEKIDGSGYPRGVKGEDIPFLVQIITVADTYDAICSNRSYSAKQLPMFAVSELMGEMFKNKLNPEIVLPFSNYVLQQFVNAPVELSDGSTGKILYFFENEPLRPIVQCPGKMIDLRRETSIHIVKVTGNQQPA